MLDVQGIAIEGPLPELQQELSSGRALLDYGPQLAASLAMNGDVLPSAEAISRIGGWVTYSVFRRLDVRYSLTAWVARTLLGQGVVRTMGDLPLAGGASVLALVQQASPEWARVLDRSAVSKELAPVTPTDVMALALKGDPGRLYTQLGHFQGAHEQVRDMLAASAFVASLLRDVEPVTVVPQSRVMRSWFDLSAFRGVRRRAIRRHARLGEAFPQWMTPHGDSVVSVNLAAMAVDWLKIRAGTESAEDRASVEQLVERAGSTAPTWLSMGWPPQVHEGKK